MGVMKMKAKTIRDIVAQVFLVFLGVRILTICINTKMEN